MTAIDRRTLITAAALSGLAAPAAAATLGQSIPVPQGFTRFPIWKGPAPGGEKVTVKEEEALRKPDGPADDSFFAHIVTPTLTMLRPARPNGAAMLLIPGGGYTRVAIGHEGYAIARRFAEAGYTCFVLLYRLPADGWAAGADAPLQDAQRALRVIRSLAPREQFSPERIGVIGFSAGGHLAAWLSTRAPRETYAPRDAIDREPLNLSVAGLMYPVIMMEGPDVHQGSRTQLLGPNPSPERMKAYSMNMDVVTTGAPPVFLAHALDDRSVPPENSLAMFAALRALKVPTECHLFENGGHGFGLLPPTSPAAPVLWPDLFLSFARRHGV
jgi:acetyl esterase/lipase